MPRKEQKLSIEQIEDFLTLTATETNSTIRAVRDFLKSELKRRERAGAAKPKTSNLPRKEQVRQAVQRHRAKSKKAG